MRHETYRLYDLALRRITARCTDASDEELATLLRLTEKYCVAYQTLAHPPVLAVTRQRATT